MSNAKAKTCHYWLNGNRCKFASAECRFIHDIGNIAIPTEPPAQEKLEIPQKRVMESDLESDLISLCSVEVEFPKKTQGTLPFGVQGRGRSPKRSRKHSPKDTPKNSPKHSAKQSPKELPKQSTKKFPRQSPKQSFNLPDESVDGTIAEDLRTAIVKRKDYAHVKGLLASNLTFAVKQSLSLTRQGVSAIFAAIDKGRNDILRLMITYGADPNARHFPSGIPVLALAIFQNNGSAVVATTILLEMGADPFVIPKDLWNDDDSYSNISDDPLSTQWCDEANKNLLAKCFNLSIKQCLQAAAKKAITPSNRENEIFGVDLVNVESSDHLLVGQEAAIRRVNEYLRCHILCGGSEPLVLAFVGPAGHGKTELARRIGTIHPLLSARPKATDLAKALVASMSTEEGEILEELPPQVPGADDINVICFDDLDKVDSQLLTSVLDGVDKAIKNKTVVVLSIPMDSRFPVDKYRHLTAEVNDHSMWMSYEAQAKKHVLNTYGHSIAGRVACVVPFIPFSDKEKALLAHKSILDAADELTKSCLFATGPNCGKHLSFTVDVDANVCQFIGGAFYDINLGARSIHQGVLSRIKLQMVEEYIKAYPSLVCGLERQSVTVHRPLSFVIRLNEYRSVSVMLE